MLALIACNPPGPWPELPGNADVPAHRVTVSPAAIDFGTLSVNREGATSATFSIHNLGSSHETVTGHDEPLGGAGFSVDAEALLALAPGESRTLTVVFAPDTEAEYAAQLVIEPAEETVDLVGRATAPVLAAGTLAMDPVVVGCTGDGTVPVTNAGSEPLSFTGATVSSGEFEVIDLPAGIAAGGEGSVGVRFTPAGGGQRGGSLLLASDDPLHPELAVAVSVLGYEGERVTEAFRYTPSNPTDILFLVDTGGGMGAQLDKAAEVLGPYVDALRAVNLDYQITALSGVDPCPSGAPAWATRADTSLRAEHVLERGFAGASGAWDDDLLDLALEALDRTGPGDCLDGFLRADADLQIVLITDGPYAGDVDDELAALDVVLANQLATGALLPLSACGEEVDALAEALADRGGRVEDLCASDWAAAFAGFATLPSGTAVVSFPLLEVPVPSTIEVEVEGATWNGLWSYDPADNAVVFDGAQVPARGAEVMIRYVSAVSCG